MAADLAALARKLHFLREAALLSPFRFLHQLPTAAWGTTREGGAAPAADAPSAVKENLAAVASSPPPAPAEPQPTRGRL